MHDRIAGVAEAVETQTRELHSFVSLGRPPGMIDLLDGMRKSAAEKLNHVLSFNAGPLIASASAREWET